MITLHTNYGDITLELDFDKAPKTAANFKQYAEDGFYSGTIFHRVIDGFMVQGGGMDENMSQKETRAPIENEADNGLKNLAGTVAMARTNDPHSASSQFFINVQDNDFLNHSGKNAQGWGYCVFGKVTDGMDVVEKIRKVKTGSKGMHQDVPVESVMIESVTVAA
jgi:peptidyl-prolyl cis-trans isomerase B (cyclophilin B)